MWSRRVQWKRPRCAGGGGEDTGNSSGRGYRSQITPSRTADDRCVIFHVLLTGRSADPAIGSALRRAPHEPAHRVPLRLQVGHEDSSHDARRARDRHASARARHRALDIGLRHRVPIGKHPRELPARKCRPAQTPPAARATRRPRPPAARSGRRGEKFRQPRSALPFLIRTAPEKIPPSAPARAHFMCHANGRAQARQGGDERSRISWMECFAPDKARLRVSAKPSRAGPAATGAPSLALMAAAAASS